jgi:uncharacterized protein
MSALARLLSSLGRREVRPECRMMKTTKPPLPPAWWVYAMTFLVAPFSMLLVALPLVVSMAVVLELIFGPLSFAEWQMTGGSEMEELLKTPERALGMGILGSTLVFSGLAWLGAYLELRRVPVESRPPDALMRRLGFGPIVPWVIFAVAFGFLALQVGMDGFLVAGAVESVGTNPLVENLNSLGWGERFALAGLSGLGVGVAEELFFRGYVLLELLRRRGPHFAILMSSSAMALLHWDPAQAPLAFVNSAYLGCAVLLSGSIWPVIVAHGVVNALTVFFVSYQAPSELAPFLGIVGFFLAIAGLIFVRRQAGRTRP